MRVAGVPARVLAAGAFDRVGDGDRERERERDLDSSERWCDWDWENERPRERDEMTLSRSSRRTGSSPIDCAAASLSLSRSSSSSGGSGGGAEISITSENMKGVVGGGGKAFLPLLRVLENGRLMPLDRRRLPRDLRGPLGRPLGWEEEGEEGGIDSTEGAPGEGIS